MPHFFRSSVVHCCSKSSWTCGTYVDIQEWSIWRCLRYDGLHSLSRGCRHDLCIEILPFSRLQIHFCLSVGSKVHPLRIIFQQWQPIWCLLGLVRECAGVIILLKWCSGSRSLPSSGTLMSVLLPRHMREVWTSRIPLWDVSHFEDVHTSLFLGHVSRCDGM